MTQYNQSGYIYNQVGAIYNQFAIERTASSSGTGFSSATRLIKRLRTAGSIGSGALMPWSNLPSLQVVRAGGGGGGGGSQGGTALGGSGGGGNGAGFLAGATGVAGIQYYGAGGGGGYTTGGNGGSGLVWIRYIY